MRPSTFLFQNLTLVVSGFGVMRFNPGSSPRNHYRISACNNEACSVTLNEVITDDFNVCYGQLSTRQDISLIVAAKQRFLGMVFNLGDDIALSARGFQPGIQPHGKYGLVYVPEIDVKGVMHKQQSYLFLSAVIRKKKHIEYFKEVAVMDDFVQNMNSERASYVGSPSGIIPQEVRRVVDAVAHDFEHHKLSSTVEAHLLNAKMHELLNHVVKGAKLPVIVRSVPDSERRALESLHAHLLAHLDSRPGTLQQMGQVAGMSSNRLNQRFKERYGATIFEYLRQKRWEKVEELLGQNVALQDITEAVGYSSVSHFTAAFKKKYGTSPGRMRGTNRSA